MSQIPLIANLPDDPTTLVDGGINSSIKEGQIGTGSQDEEIRNSTRDRLISKEENNEKKQESRRASSIYHLISLLSLIS